MKMFNRALVAGMLLLACFSLALAAKPASSGGQLNVIQVLADDPNDPTSITIVGEGLSDGGGPPTIMLGEYVDPLVIIGTATDTEIIAELPANIDGGDYLLTVSNGNGQKDNDEYDLTIGAVGPQGDKGDKGDTGANGMDGADGANGMDGAPGADGTNGIDGADGAPGSNGMDGAPGANGMNGAPGMNGADGADGANGMDGAPGTNGTDGADGANAPKPQNVLVVSPSGGDFTSIQAAVNSISGESAINRYLVKVGPGIYNEAVTMKPFVDIEGSGELTTVVKTAGLFAIFGADNVELRSLTAENTGGGGLAIGIYNFNVSPRLTNVTVTLSGGTGQNYGIYNPGSSSPTMMHVTITASGGSLNNFGVYTPGTGSPTMINVTATGSGAPPSGNVGNVGTYSPTSGTTIIKSSRFEGSDNSIRNAGGPMNVAASQLIGGPALGTVTCVASYDGSFAALNSSCL